MSNAELTGIQFSIGSDIDPKKINDLASSLKKLKDASSGANFNELSKGIASLGNTINQLNTEKLTKFGKAINSLNVKKGKAEELKNLGEGIKSLAQSLSSEAFKSAISNIGSVSRIAEAINSIRINRNTPERIMDMGIALNDLSESVSGISEESVSKMERLGYALSNLGNIKNAAKLARDIAEQEAERAINSDPIPMEVPDSNIEFPNDTQIPGGGISPEPIDINPQSLSVLERLKLLLAELKQKFVSLGSVGTKALNMVTKSIEFAGAAIGVVSKGLSKVTIWSGKKLADKISSPFKNAHKSATKFLTSLKRIAMYRAFRAVFSTLSKGLKEGIDNMYQWSLISDNKFKTSMNNLASSFLYLKNSVGAMASPLLNYLSPVIDALINKFVALLNIVNQFFARLTGASTYVRAKKVSTDYADAITGSADKANKSADKLKKAVLGFDELNQLTEKNKKSNSSNSGNKKKIPDYGSMFEEVAIDSGIKGFVDKMKTYINNEDWKGLGILLGKKVNSIIDKVDFEKMGEKFGKKFNAIFTTTYWTLKTINFKKLGKKIGKGISKAIETIDWSMFGATLGVAVTSFADFFFGLLGGIKWKSVGTAIHDFVTGFMDEVSDWLKKQGSRATGRKFAKSIAKFIDGLDITDIAKSFGNLLGSAITFSTEFTKGVWEQVLEDLNKDKPEDQKLNTKVTFGWEITANPLNWDDVKDNFKASFNDPIWKDKPDLTWKNILIGTGYVLSGSILIDFGINLVNDFIQLFVKYWNKLVEKNFDKDGGISGRLYDFFHIDNVPAPIKTIKEEIESEFSVKSNFKMIGDPVKAFHDEIDKQLQLGAPYAPKDPIKVLAELDIEKLYTSTDDPRIKKFIDDNRVKMGILGNILGIDNGLTSGKKKTVADNFLNGKNSNLGMKANINGVKNNIGKGKKKTVADNFLGGKNSDLGVKANINGVSNGVKDANRKKVASAVLHGGGGGSISANARFKVTDVKNGVAEKGRKKALAGHIINNDGTVSQGVIASVSGVSNPTKDDFISDVINGNKTYSKVGVSVSGLTSETTSGKNFINKLLPKLGTGTSSTVHVTVGGTIHGGGGGSFADGGAYFGGSWHNIAQFASGGKPTHGSMFVAGESGAEVVGHVGGRTEVLNQSQLASIMYSSVLSGMSVLSGTLAECANAIISAELETDSSLSNDRVVLASERQNRLLEEQNKLLKQILDKGTGVTSGMISQIMNAKNRRTGNTSVVY